MKSRWIAGLAIAAGLLIATRPIAVASLPEDLVSRSFLDHEAFIVVRLVALGALGLAAVQINRMNTSGRVLGGVLGAVGVINMAGLPTGFAAMPAGAWPFVVHGWLFVLVCLAAGVLALLRATDTESMPELTPAE